MVRIARYSAVVATVALLLVLLGYPWLMDHGAGMAFADVIENVQKAESLRFVFTQKLGRSPAIVSRMSIQGDKLRLDMVEIRGINQQAADKLKKFPAIFSHIADFTKRELLELDHVRKTAKRNELDDRAVSEFAKSNPIAQFRNVKQEHAQRIGQEQQDGHTIHIFQLTEIDLFSIKAKAAEEDAEMRVWVDEQTGLPVRIRIEGAFSVDRTDESYLDFQQFVWNKPLDEGLLRLDVPDGYTLKTEETTDTHAPASRRQIRAQGDAAGEPRSSQASRILSSDRVPRRIAWSSDGNLIAAVMDDPEDTRLQDRKSSELRVWEADTGDLKWSTNRPGIGDSVAWSPDGQMLVTVTRRRITLWDAATGQSKHTWTTQESNVKMALSADGKVLVCGIGEWGQPGDPGRYGGVQLWDVEQRTLQQTFRGHEWPVTYVAISPDGNSVASSSNDSPIKLWDRTTGKMQRTLAGGGCIAFSPDGKTVACASSKQIDEQLIGEVRLYELQTGDLLRTLSGHDRAKFSTVLWIAFSPDGKTIASASWDGTVKLWDALTGDLKRTLDHDGGVGSIVFSPDGRTLATGSQDKLLRLWEVN